MCFASSIDASESFGGIAQLGERWLCKPEVESSNLFASTKSGDVTEWSKVLAC